MNRKVVIRNLNVTNYPQIEEYLSKMAKKGWMIKRIITGTIFIFKKTESLDLDFSITPYEVESFLDKKTKTDLNEFKESIESTGWKYVTKSYDFHIYYKESFEDLIDLQTDVEEEFETIKRIAKKELIVPFMLIALFAIMLWFILKDIDLLGILISNTDLLVIVMSVFIVPLSIIQIIIYIRFLHRNKKNIELGNDLEFSCSNIQPKIIAYLMIFATIFIVLFFIDEIRKAIKYKDLSNLYSFIATAIGFSLGTIYRYTIKKKKIDKAKKFIYLMVVVIAAAIFTPIILINIEGEPTNEFIERNSSIFIPENYYYGLYTNSEEIGYYNALNEDIANIVVDAIIDRRKNHIKEAKNAIGSIEYEFSFITDLNTEEYIMLKKAKGTENEDDVFKEIINENIIKGEKELWDADEVYYLSRDKTIAVVRWGREVYYLKGYNFRDEKNIKEVKVQLAI